MNAYYKGQPIFGQRGPAGPDGNPVGTVISFLGLSAPAGYLVCDGSAHNISDYPDLAAFFETQFGAANHFGGDGTATFAVPDMQQTGSEVLYCIKAAESVPAENVYSAEETRIGTWIDGKPLYRKVFSGTSGGAQNVVQFGTVENLSELVYMYGKIHHIRINGYVSIPETNAELQQIGDALCIYIGNTALANQLFTVIAEYTKTTD